MHRLLLVFVLTLLPSPLLAQPGPGMLEAGQQDRRPLSLLRAWVEAQEAAARELNGLAFTEQTEWDIDGPFGARTGQRVARWSRPAGAAGWRRDVLMPPPSRRGPPLQIRRLESLLGEVLWPPPDLRRLAPAGPVLDADFDGLAARRIDLVPREHNSARSLPRRLTLWFDTDDRLLASRSVIHVPRGGSFVVDTRFQRWRGLDLPASRQAEGLLETSRRRRTFTLLVQTRSRFDAYSAGPSE